MDYRKQLTNKESILKSYADFVTTYKTLGWCKASFGSYEDMAMFLVSPRVYAELLQVSEKLGLWNCEKIYLSVLSKPEYAEEFILLSVFNNTIKINDKELQPIVD